ncbi:amidase family protein [Catenulispora yoronensis]
MNRKTSGSQPTPQSPGVNDAFVGWIPVLDAAEDRGGPLGGVRLAVKDVLDVAGLPTGAGHPRWLATHDVPARDATAVARLRAAGATVVGKTHTDELAYSLGGTSRHYGAAPNPAAPDRLTGGSSGGAASAVAGGLADLSLATDTAGSIRIPASYCGLYGLRPTHGRVPADGIVPLAPSFDVAGLLTRRLELLTVAAGVLLDPAPGTAAPPGCGPRPTCGRRRLPPCARRWPGSWRGSTCPSTARRCSTAWRRGTRGAPRSAWSRRSRRGARTARGSRGSGRSSGPGSGRASRTPGGSALRSARRAGLSCAGSGSGWWRGSGTARCWRSRRRRRRRPCGCGWAAGRVLREDQAAPSWPPIRHCAQRLSDSPVWPAPQVPPR